LGSYVPTSIFLVKENQRVSIPSPLQVGFQLPLAVPHPGTVVLLRDFDIGVSK